MTGKSKRGFASMDQAKQREIASKGGKAAHQKGTAHEFTSEEAREAGRKGGEAVSRDRAHMAAIGREGGKNSHKGSRKNLNSGENSPATESIGENSSDFGNSEANSWLWLTFSRTERVLGVRCWGVGVLVEFPHLPISLFPINTLRFDTDNPSPNVETDGNIARGNHIAGKVISA